MVKFKATMRLCRAMAFSPSSNAGKSQFVDASGVRFWLVYRDQMSSSSTTLMLPNVFVKTSSENGGLSHVTSVMPSMACGQPRVWMPS